MLVERAELEAMKMGDLKHLILESGGEPSPPSETKEALVNRLLLQAAQEAQNDKVMPPTEAKEVVRPVCTIEQVKDAVNQFILRGMKVFYDRESDCWLFRVQIKSLLVRDSNTGETRVIERFKDDSGTMKQPLSVIKGCARALMQNAQKPEAIKPQFNPADSYESVA